MCSFHITLLLGKLHQEVHQATDREGRGVFSRGVFAKRPGDRLQTSYRRKTLTYVYPPWRIPCARPLRSMRRCRRWCPLNYWKMMLRRFHPSSQAFLGRWERRRLS